MRSKTKRTACLVSFAAMLCLLLPFWFLRGETASAATTPSYTVAFDYTHTYTYGSGAGTRKETSGDNNVYSAVVQSGSNTSATISVIMYGSGASGNVYLSNGGTIKSDTVNIQISGYNERRITVTDASGRNSGERQLFRTSEWSFRRKLFGVCTVWLFCLDDQFACGRQCYDDGFL